MSGPSFSFVCLSVPEKREMKLFEIWKLERKKNEEIMGRISSRSLVLFHIKQQMIHNICTNLQNSMCNSSWEIFVTNFPMYITLEREMEKRKKKAKYISAVLFSVPIYLATLNVYTQFEDSGSHRRWEICSRKFAWRERKMDIYREW